MLVLRIPPNFCIDSKRFYLYLAYFLSKVKTKNNNNNKLICAFSFQLVNVYPCGSGYRYCIISGFIVISLISEYGLYFIKAIVIEKKRSSMMFGSNKIMCSVQHRVSEAVSSLVTQKWLWRRESKNCQNKTTVYQIQICLIFEKIHQSI